VQNKEFAIADYEAALAIAPQPFMQMAIHKQLAAIYHARHLDNPQKNLGEAITHIKKALALHPREKDPYVWAGLLIDRGMIFGDLLMADPEEAMELALADYTTALSILTPHPYAFTWSRALLNRAGIYALRIKRDRRQNWEQALADLEAALTVDKCTGNHQSCAAIHQSRAAILAFFDEQEKLEEAITEYGLALSFYNPIVYPFERLTLLVNRAPAFMKLGRWHEAHHDYLQAREIQREALEHAASEGGRAALIALRAKPDMYLAMWRLCSTWRGQNCLPRWR